MTAHILLIDDERKLTDPLRASSDRPVLAAFTRWRGSFSCHTMA